MKSFAHPVRSRFRRSTTTSGGGGPSRRVVNSLRSAADALDACRTGARADAGLAGPWAVVASDPVAEELDRLLRQPAATGLLGVDRQAQTFHQRLDRRQHLCRRRFAEYADVVRLVDDLRLEAPGVAQRLPAQEEATHVDIAQQRRDRGRLRGPSTAAPRPVRATATAVPWSRPVSVDG